jgi:Glucose-6-phosphate dehydrogenase, NAD binding domain
MSSADTWKNPPSKEEAMNVPHSDALVFFGATGDLAYKKIFPALQAMVKRGHLNVPVIGVAKAGWNLDQLRERAQDSVEKHGGINPAAFDKLCSLLGYVDGDYNDPQRFRLSVRSLARRSTRRTISPSRLCCSGWSWNNWPKLIARTALASSLKNRSVTISSRRNS